MQSTKREGKKKKKKKAYGHAGGGNKEKRKGGLGFSFLSSEKMEKRRLEMCGRFSKRENLKERECVT